VSTALSSDRARIAPPPPPSNLTASPARPAVTWRAVLLGLVGTCVICGVTPYNDYALNNTFMVGNNLPIGAVMLTFLFTLLVNAPLHRWAPRHALSSGEMAVALSMTLVSCALPSSGLMRYWPSSLVGPFWHARGNNEYLEILESLKIPRWIWPSFEGAGPRDWINSPIVSGFYLRWTEPGGYPYAAWLVPAATWGVFLFALYGAMLCMVSIVRRQWFENERLPFPLAQIHLALIDQPVAGRAFNETLRQRSFWVAFATVFVLHGLNALYEYDPAHFVPIPIKYEFYNLLADPPWSYVQDQLKENVLYFTAVGVAFFLPTSVAFSLWFFYVFHQLTRMVLGQLVGDPDVHGQADQHFGGIIAFTLVMLWVGRHHWWLVIRQAFRGPRDEEPRGRYLSYPLAFWGLVASTLMMIGWLVVAGAGPGGATVIVLLLLMGFLVITRIVAEAGLVHGQIQIPIFKPWTLLATYGWAHPVSVETFYHSAMLQGVHYDFREVVPVYASHGMKLADQTAYGGQGHVRDTDADRRTGRRFVAALALALLVGYGVSLYATLWTEYSYSSTLDRTEATPINQWGAQDDPLWLVIDPTLSYTKSNYNVQHSPALHLAIGFVVTGALGFLRLRFTWWPLHPIGYLMIGTFPGAHLWFSIFIGWLAKVLIMKFGGARLYTAAKPLFLGLIVGEAAACGFWLVMGIVMSELGVPYEAIRIMPY
jgi:hypothetical protein